MKPIKFKESNITFGVGQEGVQELPALLLPEHGEVISCWKLSFKEMLRLLLTRRLWLCVATFGKPLQPLFMSTRSEDIFTTNNNNNKKD